VSGQVPALQKPYNEQFHSVAIPFESWSLRFGSEIVVNSCDTQIYEYCPEVSFNYAALCRWI